MNTISTRQEQPDRVIGAKMDGGTITLSDIRYLVLQLRPLVEGRDICLAFDDSLLFLGAFLAASHYGKSVILPGNDKPDWLRMAGIGYDCLLTDRDGTDGVLVSWPGEEDAPASSTIFDALPDHDAPVFLYTSGSTGQPKAVRHYRRQFELETAAIARVMPPIAPNSLVLSTVPHGHMYGLTFRIMFPWFQGHVISSGITQYWSDLDSWLTGKRANWCLISSPAHLTRLQSLPATIPQPAMIMSSAGPLPGEDAQHCADNFGCWPFEIFGSTETGAIAHRSQQDENDWWHLAPNASLAPAPDDGYIVNAPWIDGDWSLEDRLELSSTCQEFRHLGRMDDIIKLEGKRVSLGEVSRHVQTLQEVKTCRILPHPEKRGLAAIIVLSQVGNQALSQTGGFRLGRYLRQALAATLESAALPRHWKFVAALPTDARGKTPRGMLEALMKEPIDPEPDQPGSSPGYGAIRHRGDLAVEQSARLDAGMAEFAGHFPGAPVFPGIAMIDWVIRLSRNLPGCKGSVTGLGKVKFKQLVQPPADITLLVEQKQTKSGIAFARFTLTGNAGELASGEVRFGGHL